MHEVRPRQSHGKSKTRLYAIWSGMKARCYNPARNRFAHYGGRGIQVCPEWKDSFLEFEKWALGNGYSEKLTIERIDNDGNYTPENCKWVTSKEQAKNKSSNRKIFGVNTGEWAARLGGNHKLVSNRISTLGWSEEKAVSTPKRTPIRIAGKTLQEWSDEKNIPKHTIWDRLRRGWTEKQAIGEEPSPPNKYGRKTPCMK